MTFENPSREHIKEILANAGNIAVVGLSDKPDRTSHMVAAAMQSRGYRIIPVNPNATEILGEKCYDSLSRYSGASRYRQCIPPGRSSRSRCGGSL